MTPSEFRALKERHAARDALINEASKLRNLIETPIIKFCWVAGAADGDVPPIATQALCDALHERLAALEKELDVT